jgi:hypothetical protein
MKKLENRDRLFIAPVYKIEIANQSNPADAKNRAADLRRYLEKIL